MVIQALPFVQVGTPHAAVNLNPLSGLNVLASHGNNAGAAVDLNPVSGLNVATSHGSNVQVQGITAQGLVSLINLLTSLQRLEGKGFTSDNELYENT